MAFSVQDYYLGLHKASEQVVLESTSNQESLGKVHQFIQDLHLWSQVLEPKSESRILAHVRNELQFSVLSLVYGLYRQAFGSLRLAFELTLAACYFSAYRLNLAEWERGEKGNGDVKWSVLIHDGEGVLSARFAKAFFPSLQETAKEYRAIAELVYREMSEFVHGNASTWKLTPEDVRYDKALFEAWMEKFSTASRVMVLSLSLRFLKELGNEGRNLVEHPVLEHLGHIGPIRAYVADGED